MAKKPLPTIEQLRQLLECDAASGTLTWKPRGPEWFTVNRFSLETRAKQWNAIFAGQRALDCLSDQGYKTGMLLGRSARAHSVIWAMHHGKWPEGEIDHINGDRADNRIENLRDVSRSMNLRNCVARKDNKSGQVGVWRVKGGKWQAFLYVGGQRHNLGRFEQFADAVKARKSAEKAHGFTLRHGS